MTNQANLKLSVINLDPAADFGTYQKFLRSEAKHRFATVGVKRILFIPYPYDGADYEGFIKEVRSVFSPLFIDVTLITEGDPAQLIKAAQGIVIGGNDLGRLQLGMQSLNKTLKKKLESGTPFMSWNAGSVYVSPTYIQQPVIPISSNCLGIVQNQHVCHYLDSISSRLIIETFLNSHPNIPEVVCMMNPSPLLPDGSGLRYEDDDAGLVYKPIPNSFPPLVFKNTEFGFIQV